MTISLPAKAIRIGLIEGVKETKIAVSSDGSIYDAKTQTELLRLTPMVSYTLKSGRKSIQIKINRKYYNLNSKNIIIKTILVLKLSSAISGCTDELIAIGKEALAQNENYII